MSNLWLSLALLLTLTPCAFFGGLRIMSAASGRDVVTRQLALAPQKDRKPLGQRRGYDVQAAVRHWGALDAPARDAEILFLKMDLLFPLVYGAALAVSLLVGRAALGKTFSYGWIIAPIALTILADWTENIVQLGQLRRFRADAIDGNLNSGWIQVGSLATVLKTTSFSVAGLFVSWLAVLVVVRMCKAA